MKISSNKTPIKLKRGVSDHDNLNDSAVANFELTLMRVAEEEQVDPNVDTFWGLDEESRRCAGECANMILEDEFSTTYEAHMRERELISQWDDEDNQRQYDVAYDQAVVEARARKKYIQELHSTKSTREVMMYKWPTRDYVLPAPISKKAAKHALFQESLADINRDMFQPSYDQNMEEALFGVIEVDNQSSSVVHGESLQRTRSIEAQFEQDAELAARVLRGKSVGTSIAERAMYPNAPPQDPTHGGGLEQSLGVRTTKPAKNQIDGHGGAENAELHSDMTLDDQAHGMSLAFLGQAAAHMDELDGHPTYKWDQEMTLQAMFNHASGSSGALSLATFIEKVNDPVIMNLVRFTVLGAWTKLRQWHMFETVFNGIDVESDDELSVGDLHLTLEDWQQAARAAASEEGVLPQHIRTQDEHRTIVQSSGPWMKILGEGSKSWFATRSREEIYRNTRDAFIARRILRGDLVWGLYGASCTWLPATVERANSDGTFDLVYPMNARELRDAQVRATSRELLSLPSMEPKREHIPRPDDSERDAVAHAFDLVDEELTGAVEPQQLLSALKSQRFEKIIKGSLSLYIIFGVMGGSESLESNLINACAEVSGGAGSGEANGGTLIEKDAFVEYCMAIADLGTFNEDLVYLQ